MTEEQIAIKEAARNAAVDEYFKARPQLMRTRHEECLVEAGFNAAWQACAARMVPEGFVMVPVEPTPEMQAAGAQSIRFDTTTINKLWTGNKVYRAMLSAAPEGKK